MIIPEILQALYNINAQPIREWPYPHLYVENVFPKNFYHKLKLNLPSDANYLEFEKIRDWGGKLPPNRSVFPIDPEQIHILPKQIQPFWREASLGFLSATFREGIAAKFERYLRYRFANANSIKIISELLLVQDRTNYKLGPHTDSVRKVIACLFYLPDDDSHPHLGTSIYIPKIPGLICNGGPHYNFSDFERVTTMPFKPNSMFAFLKTNNSFHGVEPLNEDNYVRRLMLYDLQVIEA